MMSSVPGMSVLRKPKPSPRESPLYPVVGSSMGRIVSQTQRRVAPRVILFARANDRFLAAGSRMGSRVLAAE